MAYGDSSDKGTIVWTAAISIVFLVLIAVSTHRGGADPGPQSTAAPVTSAARANLTPEQLYPIGRYPAWVEQMVMQPCETKSTVTFCTCVMSYVEHHESVEAFSYEAQIWEQGGYVQRLPPTAMAATNVCPVW